MSSSRVPAHTEVTPRTPAPHGDGGLSRTAARRLARARRRTRRRWVVAGAVFVSVAVAGAAVHFDALASLRPGPVAAGVPAAADTGAGGGEPSADAVPPSPAASPSPSVPASLPVTGPGTFVYDTTTGPVLGAAGRLRRFHVAVETGVDLTPAVFAQAVDRTLGDARSWIAGGQLRLERVPEGVDAEFTIFLATRETSRRMCAQGGVDTDGYTSCRTFGRVIINLDRWFQSVPDYVGAGIPLEVYRDYVVNHEVGHQLGHGHELCPGAGRPAPVMQTQTLGLAGCTANPWPYLDGRRYAGAPGR